jgi:adenosylcobinamide-GDP ribazoletransferase
MRSLILAIQFLTRLPTPQLRNFDSRELASCAPWFPWVGMLVGGLVTVFAMLGNYIDSWVGALLALLIWIWTTGALHLDGLADLADGLGAAHRDPQRLLAVMRDPHLGAFGVIALITQCLSKLVLLRVSLDHAVLSLTTLPLICAWARFGALLWSAYLPALPGSSTEKFTWHINRPVLFGNALLLIAITIYCAPALLIAPFILIAWGLFLKYRLGGMSGDCLGAGVEITESVLLLVTLIAGVIPVGWPR